MLCVLSNWIRELRDQNLAAIMNHYQSCSDIFNHTCIYNKNRKELRDFLQILAYKQ